MSNKDEDEVPERETRRILQRVYSRLRKEDQKPKNTKFNDRLTKLTGLNPNAIAKLKNDEQINISLESVHRQEILDKLIQFYLVHKIMPTTMQLLNGCKDIVPEQTDVSGFRKLLSKMDFVWKKMPADDTFVILERPETTYDRYKFLKSILADTYSDIYIVEEIGYDYQNGGTVHDFCSSLKNEHMNKMIYAVSRNKIIYNGKHEAKFTSTSFINWIVQELIPNLDKPSVIVFNNSEHHCELLPQCTDLTIESLRCEMTDWLDRNNVPYRDTMSKVELYSLIESCTDKHVNKYIVDNIIFASGHTPLRIPDHLVSLTPGHYVAPIIQKLLRLTPNQPPQEIWIPEDKLQGWFETIFIEYKRMFDLDLQVDQCLDGVIMQMELLPIKELSDEDSLPSFSDDSD